MRRFDKRVPKIGNKIKDDLIVIFWKETRTMVFRTRWKNVRVDE